MNQINFFFQLAKEANYAQDEDGNPAECYLKIGFNLEQPIEQERIDEERKRAKDDVIKTTAELLNLDECLLTMITEQEYEECSKNS